ncbi:amidohydrolase family protein [Halorubrum ezzemoulense]|nr:amidohydrolase family protein [Halorubrum ezzemoulense]MDB2264111.1 amidohydrolase family protein [Halorubrum ezzemoulense]
MCTVVHLRYLPDTSPIYEHEGAEALGVGDEIGSLEPGKRADVILLDVEKPKFTPLTNIPAQVTNNAAPADVETVIVDGDVLMKAGDVKTMETDAVRDRVEAAVDRFESGTEWELGIGESEPPSTMNVARDLPKRGPSQLLGRLAFQSLRDRLPL